MTINELQDEVIEEFSDFTDWMDKYQLLIDLGNELQPLDAKYKTEDNLIDGCQSRVWLQADMTAGNRRRRPVFHRPHRPARPPVPHPFKRPAGNAQADEAVRCRIFGKINLRS